MIEMCLKRNFKLTKHKFYEFIHKLQPLAKIVLSSIFKVDI